MEQCSIQIPSAQLVAVYVYIYQNHVFGNLGLDMLDTCNRVPRSRCPSYARQAASG
jgi:hypothetical protein